SFKERWYLLASTDENPEPHIYALDWFLVLQQSVIEWTIPEDFNAEEYFAPYLGYPLGSEKYDSPVTVKVKVNAHQRDYFRTLPLHSSQEEIELHDDYSIFTYRVIPNFYLKKELISYMDAVEVLEPEKLKVEIEEALQRTIHKYR
ncbi:MAG: WYL domain-containing protein, partial [Bacteroidales bacterium]|nr:WYL domain-containing protein [Bacteroidales bacterium]